MLLFVWLWLYVSASAGLQWIPSSVQLFATGALAVFGLGGLHYLVGGMEKVARTYRIVALAVGMAALFLITFRFYSQMIPEFSEDFMVSRPDFLVASILALLILILDWVLRRDAPFIAMESSVCIGLVALLRALHYLPPTTLIYVIAFNQVFFCLTL